MPPPQPPEQEKAQAILPSTRIPCGAIGPSQNRCIFQDGAPLLVGLSEAPGARGGAAAWRLHP